MQRDDADKATEVDRRYENHLSIPTHEHYLAIKDLLEERENVVQAMKRLKGNMEDFNRLTEHADFLVTSGVPGFRANKKRS